MATWMSHFRIAEYFLDKLENISEIEFIVGNIGPDCGEPNSDWSEFTPPREITHWRNERSEFGVDLDGFYNQYLAEPNRYFSFYLGYYIHLLADIEWEKQISCPKINKFKSEFEKNKHFIWDMKKDWYDLDHLFLKEHPTFKVFLVFSMIDEFPNKYLDYYSDTAIIRQIKFITNFYKNYSGDLNREFIYLTKEEMDKYHK
ncbi:MAG TPA: zinc dependent phospholipase C family protein [Clostridiaceae bacterium]|nr:zinc dependent phospholipase C family protein [Clostridiaceae bacterium]